MNTNREARTEKRERLLLVRLRLIGDVVFTTPLLRTIRRQFPDAHLTYVVEPAAAPVVIRNPHLDEVLVIPKRSGLVRWWDDLGVARRLRASRYDVAIDLHGGPRSAWLTWASGAPMRIGYTTMGRTWMYTHPIPRPADLAPVHSVVKQWALLAPLGIAPPDRSEDATEMAEDAAAGARVAARLREAGVTEAHDLIVIHVSAGNPFRRWPVESFVEVVVALAAGDTARRIILTSGPSDAAAARQVADAARRRLGGRAVQVPDTGEFDLAELRALVARAAVYIGGDSGPLHIAGTTRTPVVALLGPTLSERSMPWRDAQWFAEAVDAGPLPCRPCAQRVCEPGDFRCLTTIPAARVIEAAERALAAGRLRLRA